MLCRLFIIALLSTVVSGLSTAQTPILPEAELGRIRALLPQMADRQVAAIQADPTTLWYTRAVMPRAYQKGSDIDSSGSPAGWALANVNTSGDAPDNRMPDGVGGNANVEASFPWSQHAGGTHLSRDAGDFKALWLPKKGPGVRGQSGRSWPGSSRCRRFSLVRTTGRSAAR